MGARHSASEQCPGLALGLTPTRELGKASLVSSHVMIVFLVMHVSCEQRNCPHYYRSSPGGWNLVCRIQAKPLECAGCPSSSNNLLHTLFDIKTRKRGERKGAECDGGCRRSVPLSQMATGSDIAPRNKSPQEKIGTWCDRFARLGGRHDRCSTVCTAISDTMKARLLH